MDRLSIKSGTSGSGQTKWVCPTCGSSLLIIRDGSFNKAETRSSSDHSHVAWEPDWITYIYTCVLDCQNRECKESIISSGTGAVKLVHGHYDYDAESYFEEYYDWFEPRFFEPPLRLFSLPNTCPRTVSAPLIESFRLFFVSPSAAANNLRVAIEALLTELGIVRYRIARRRRLRLHLHERILRIPRKHVALQEMFYAVKWLGNAGSHSLTELKPDDVLDAYELTEHILAEVFEEKSKTINRLAKRVNKRKGPEK